MLAKKEKNDFSERFKSKLRSILFKSRAKIDAMSWFYGTHNAEELFNIKYHDIVTPHSHVNRVLGT